MLVSNRYRIICLSLGLYRYSIWGALCTRKLIGVQTSPNEQILFDIILILISFNSILHMKYYQLKWTGLVEYSSRSLILSAYLWKLYNAAAKSRDISKATLQVMIYLVVPPNGNHPITRHLLLAVFVFHSHLGVNRNCHLDQSKFNNIRFPN